MAIESQYTIKEIELLIKTFPKRKLLALMASLVSSIKHLKLKRNSFHKVSVALIAKPKTLQENY